MAAQLADSSLSGNRRKGRRQRFTGLKSDGLVLCLSKIKQFLSLPQKCAKEGDVVEKNSNNIGFYLGFFFLQLILQHTITKNVKTAQKFSICSSHFNEIFCKILNTMLNLSSISTSSNTNT